MAGASLLTLFDDIAAVLDDVAAMTKLATRKTAGVLGDDLALNAQQVSGVRADRELPVVWAVAKGSVRNKLILIPAALAISALMPWAIVPLLMLGGAFLCYEGFEKLAHRFLHPAADDAQDRAQHLQALASAEVDIVAFEKDKIRGAVRTDFILSAEIIVISLGTVAAVSFGQQLMVLTAIAAIMTVGVYGLVAGIVKLDDAGLHLSRGTSGAQRALGRALLALAPWLMKALSVLGTAAMFMVGGGILTHGIPSLHQAITAGASSLLAMPGLGVVFAALAPTVLNALAGIAAGAVVLLVVNTSKAVVKSVRGG
jgi:predicted DNA repair protein MutK